MKSKFHCYTIDVWQYSFLNPNHLNESRYLNYFYCVWAGCATMPYGICCILIHALFESLKIWFL